MHVVKKLVFVYSMIRDSYTVGKRARSAASANHEPSRTREERGLRYVEVRLQDICFDDLDQLQYIYLVLFAHVAQARVGEENFQCYLFQYSEPTSSL